MIGAVVLAIVVLGIRRVWIFTWVHDRIVDGKDAQLALLTAELERERRARQDWERMALLQVGAIERTVQTTTEIVQKVVGASSSEEVTPS